MSTSFGPTSTARRHSSIAASNVKLCARAASSVKPLSNKLTRSLPLITGAFCGNTIDFRQCAAEGVTLLGRMEAASEGVVEFAPDLAKRLAYGDASYAFFLDMADAHVESHGLKMPQDLAARAVLPDPPCLSEPLRRLDLRAADIGAVIWATGYGFDLGWIHVPVLNTRGEPVHLGASPTCRASISSACNGCPN